MEYCTHWESLASILQMTTSDIAAWVGAIGTVGAALWAARTYYNDRSEKQKEDARRRQLSVLRQGLLLRPFLLRYSEELGKTWSRMKKMKPGETCRLFDAFQESPIIREIMTDPWDFQPKLGAQLLWFATEAERFRGYGVKGTEWTQGEAEGHAEHIENEMNLAGELLREVNRLVLDPKAPVATGRPRVPSVT